MLFLFKSFAFACENCKICRKTIAMKDMEFECICAKICEGIYDPADIPADLDNLFYENFGMSCYDVVSAFQCAEA